MTSPEPDRPSLRAAVEVLFRHRRKLGVVFCAGMLLTLSVIALYPRSYQSEAKLFVRVGRESVALDPTATTGQTLLLQKSQVDEINSALDLLTSTEMRRHTVERVGAKRILEDAPVGNSESAGGSSLLTSVAGAADKALEALSSVLQRVRLSDPGTEEERALRRLESGLRVWAPKESTVITISYRAASPELAHDIVGALTAVFLDHHLRLNQVDGSLQFFEKQAEQLHSELSAAERELRNRKNEFQMVSLAGKRALIEEQIRDVRLQMLNTQRDLAFSEARVTDLTRAIASLQPEIVASRVAGIANEAKDGMREKLYELELEESKLRSGYQDKHPLMMQIRRQREVAEQIVAELPSDRTQTTSALNPNQRALELQRLEAEADVEALHARQQASTEQLASLHQDLKSLNNHELQFAELEREADLLEQSYRMHAEKLEQARVNDALGRDKISNVKEAQPATLQHKPVSPKKIILLALGIVLSTCASFGSVIVAETLDPTVRTAEEVERQLGLPVLLTLPHRKLRRRSRRSTSIAAKERNSTMPARGIYGELVNELLWSRGDARSQTMILGIVGCSSSRSRSHVAAQLAKQAAAARADRVLLIDADARRQTLGRRFHVTDAPGWRDMLGGHADLHTCVHRRNGSGLAVMAPGRANGTAVAADPLHGTSSQLEEISSEYDLVVVDLPSSRDWGGPLLTAGSFSEVLIVLEAERTTSAEALRLKNAVERAGVRIGGVVLTNQREYLPRWLSHRLG